MATTLDVEYPTGIEVPANQVKVSQVTTKRLTNTFYNQSPRLHTAVSIPVSENLQLPRARRPPANADQGRFSSCLWSRFGVKVSSAS